MRPVVEGNGVQFALGTNFWTIENIPVHGLCVVPVVKQKFYANSMMDLFKE